MSDNKQVFLFKLVSGEEVLAEVIGDVSAANIRLKDPIELHVNEQPPKIHPWAEMFLDENNELTLPSDGVMFAIPADEQLTTLHAQANQKVDEHMDGLVTQPQPVSILTPDTKIIV